MASNLGLQFHVAPNICLQRRITRSNHSVSVSSSNGPIVPSSSGDSKKKGPMVMEIPLDKIRRPLMRTRANDPAKVQELMDSIRVIGLQVPVFLGVIATRLINALVSRQSDAKFVEEPKKH